MQEKIELIHEDITELKVDAIVNAANTLLLGGGGLDGAIHVKAGPRLLEECRGLGGCPTGDVKITKGYNLPAKYVIHAVGPVWNDGQSNESQHLTNCYRRSFEIALENNIKSIAFPCISAGIYRYPKSEAADIAVKTVKSFLEQGSAIEKVIFCCFSDQDYTIYQSLLSQ